MKEIEQIVTDYLQTEQTDFAIMINGDWGCGKTYYIKKILFDKITSIDSFSKDKEENHIKYEPIYVSLYGIADNQDLLYKVQLELNEWMKSKAWSFLKKSVGKVASAFNVEATDNDEKEILSALSISKNKVLFLDDLERIDNTKISITNVLGQINHFTEQENLKVVIICNKDKTDEVFSEINEKTVRFSCEYNPNLEDLYDSFIENYKGKYNEFLNDQKDIVLNVFKVAKYKNLRTLRFILDVYEKIYNEVKGKDYEVELLVRFFYFIIIYSLEYKTGRSREELKSIENAGPFSKRFSVNFDRLISSAKTEEKKDKEPSYYKIFTDKYQELIENFNYSEEIANYVHNGYLDKAKLSKEIDEIQQEIKANKGTEEENLTNRIRNWRSLKNDELLPTLEEVYTMIDAGKFRLGQFFYVFYEFLQLENYGLESIQVTAEVIERFKRGIDIAKEKQQYFENLSYHLPLWSVRIQASFEERMKEMYEYILEANDYISIKKNGEKPSLLDFIKNDQEDEVLQCISNSELRFTPIFDHLNTQEVFELLINAKKTTVDAFSGGLYDRYPFNEQTTNESFTKDMRFFFDLQELVQKHIDSIETKRISTAPLIDLNKNLKRILQLTVR